MKIKTSELSGVQLDWAVAKAEGVQVSLARGGWYVFDSEVHPEFSNDYNDSKMHSFRPSTDWAQGGPIIQREGISIDCIRWDGKVDGWIATLPTFDEAKYEEPSPTPLIAAMRCYVISKLGNEVEVPDGLA
jgi:hypothetical protein